MNRSVDQHERQLRDVCSTVPVGMFVGDSHGRWSFVNEPCAKLLGGTHRSDHASSAPAKSDSPEPIDWLQHVHASDVARVTRQWNRFLRSDQPFSEEFRLQHADGMLTWVQADASKRFDQAGTRTGCIGTIVTTSANREVEQLLELENELLESVARGLPLEEALLRLVRFIEKQADDMLASVLLMDADGTRLRHGAAPSLDADYNELVDGIAVGEGVGSCGTAAFRREPVFVEDIESDPLWAGVRQLARPYKLRACWSTPLKDRSGTVLGTFAVYRSVPGGPTAQHLRIIDVATHLASIVLARHRDDQKLLQSEQRFRRMFEHAAVGVTQVDSLTGVILQVNRRYCEILGASEKELRGKTWMQLTHPEDIAVDEAQMTRLLAGEIREFAIEKRLRRGDNSYTLINLTVSAMWPIGEKPTTHSAIVEDITKRKQAEEALRLSEERFRNLVQTAPFGVLRNDPVGRINFANAALGTIYECAPSDLIGKSIWELAFDDSSREAMIAKMRDLEEKAEESRRSSLSTGFLVKHRTAAGRAIDVHVDWTNERSRDGRNIGWIVVISDVTTRREFERRLEFQAVVLNRVSDAVIVTDQHNAVTYANEAAERMFDITNDHRSGRSVLPLHQELLGSGTMRHQVLAALEKTGQWQGDVDIPVDGQAATVEAKLKDFRSPNSQGHYLLSLVRDISMRKQSELERRQHRDTLAHMTRLSTMGELVAGIAHEVKQPLYAIANFATAASISLRNLQPGVRLNQDWLDDLKEFNDGVRRASQRANEIIQRLREFAGKSEQTRERIDFNEVVLDSIDLVAFEARQCDAIVQTNLQIGLPEVIADRIQCEQVVVNLLHNAYEALTEVGAPRRVLLQSRQVEDFIEFKVEDNGPGVPPSQYGKIFEAFCTTKPSGMGMGLAISRTIVEDHGGRLTVEANRQGGATFVVSLPVANRGLGADLPMSAGAMLKPTD